MKAVLAGGDRRMELTRELLIEQGYQVEWIRTGEDQHWQEQLMHSDLLLLPYPHAVRKGVIPGWESGGEGSVEKLLERLKPGTKILAGAGLQEVAVGLAQARGLSLTYYQDDPVFLQRNTEISAEAAVAALMQRTDCVLDEVPVLLLGYGAFGRAIAVRLRALGARVWVAARRQAQQRLAIHDGMTALGLEKLVSVAPEMQAVLNTIPAVVLDRERLSCFSKYTLFLELASPPYGIDLPAAAELGLRAEVLPGLPSQYAPLSAARALKETIMNRFREG